MTDLDASLAVFLGAEQTPWSEPRAVTVARAVTDALGVWMQYEPPDEEWAIWYGTGPYLGMISVRYPLAIVTEAVGPWLRENEPDVRVEIIEDFLDEELRASPELLRGTLLPWGWEIDFDTEGFSANDLFVESV